MFGSLPATFRFLEFFRFFFPIFSAQTCFFELKVEKKIYMGVFYTHFVPLISTLASKLMECKLLRTRSSSKFMEFFVMRLDLRHSIKYKHRP